MLFSTCLATQTALLPFFLATAMVTAGNVSAARHLLTVVWMGRSETDTAVGKHLLGAVLHRCHIPQVDRSALVEGDEQVLDLLNILDKGACFDPNHLIGFFIFAALHLGIGHLNCPGNFHGGKTVCSQAFRIQIDVGHSFSATVHTDSGTVGNVLQFSDDLLGYTVQMVVVHLLTVEGHIDDGNVVDFNGLDNPSG